MYISTAGCDLFLSRLLYKRTKHVFLWYYDSLAFCSGNTMVTVCLFYVFIVLHECWLCIKMNMVGILGTATATRRSLLGYPIWLSRSLSCSVGSSSTCMQGIQDGTVLFFVISKYNEFATAQLYIILFLWYFATCYQSE